MRVSSLRVRVPSLSFEARFPAERVKLRRKSVPEHDSQSQGSAESSSSFMLETAASMKLDPRWEQSSRHEHLGRLRMLPTDWC